MKNLFKVQSFVLLIGTLFAWTTVYLDFSRFYHQYGTLIRIKDCVIPNPVTTPCFYGAFVFLFGFFWSLMILKKSEADKSKEQRKLNIILLAGTIFAWSNFTIETVKFYFVKSSPKITCSGIPTDNILFTSCFYGSILFLISFIISMIIIKKSKN